jgi:serine/threonine protein kinase
MERRNGPLQSLVGKRLGKYQITSQLGRGASGTVFLAHHTMLNIPVALKFLDPALVSYHPELLQRFMHEARSAARINHPNIVRVVDCDQIEGLNLIVMEYVDGISLSELININGHVPEDRALVMTRSVAEGLEAALEVGIIHRDIKPANIMVTKSKQVKLADLGLAKRVDGGADLSDTRPNTGMGTPHYFAPEQASDASTVDHRSDIYALGATLFHMLTGRIPYEGRNLQELARMHQMEPIPMACTLRPNVSEETSHLITRMMAKNPADRFATYADLINTVQACIVAKRHYQSAGANSDPSRGQRSSALKSIFGIFGDKK